MVRLRVLSATISLMIPKRIRKNTGFSTITVNGSPHLGQERPRMAKGEQDNRK
jgi:hypothetical protein